MTVRSMLRLDPIACDGRGLCAEALPELITLDDWGFPIIDAGGVPENLESEALEAVRICPKLALRLARPRQSRGAAGIAVRLGSRCARSGDEDIR